MHHSMLQLKALARITIKPLVETLPCVGGITLSLMEVRRAGAACIACTAHAACNASIEEGASWVGITPSLTAVNAACTA